MFKDKVVDKDGWLWPISDEMAWKWQHEFGELSDKVMPYVKKKNCMIQAGGNCGFILQTFVPHFQKIYTFEPDSINFYCLVNNVQNENVIKIQACLGSNREQVNTKQLVRENKPHDVGGVHVSGEGNIPTIIIDDLNLKECDLIQLDIEGYELFALHGAKNTILNYKPVLCIEFCDKWLNRYGKNSEELHSFLKEIEYVEVNSYGADKIFIPKNY